MLWTEILSVIWGILWIRWLPVLPAAIPRMQEQNPLAAISPQDIESIEILKDASGHSDLWFAGCQWRSADYYY